MGSLQWTWFQGFARDGDAIRHRGGVDCRPGKVNALIFPKDGFMEDGSGLAATSKAYALVYAESPLD
jgi:hypothetical protein